MISNNLISLSDQYVGKDCALAVSMGRVSLEYPKDALNTVKRHGYRGFYELEVIHNIIDSSKVLHVSFNDPNTPFNVVLPMIGIMTSFERPSAGTNECLDLYLHGHVNSRLLNIGRREGSTGLPVTVAACHLDGLVLALSAFSHNFNYRSAVLYGYASPVTDVAEKLFVMERVTNNFIPSHWQHTRLPPTEREVKALGVLKVKITSGSAKIRTGQATDEMEDMEDDTSTGRFWSGVLPIHQVMGEPVPSSYNKVAPPPHVLCYRDSFNEENRQNAYDAIEKPEKLPHKE